MPHKYNADRRHHIARPKRRVTNWSDYNEALRQRGSLTVWFTDEAIAAWKAAPRTTPGGQAHYSDLAITTALTLRAVFHLPLRRWREAVRCIIPMPESSDRWQSMENQPFPTLSVISNRSELSGIGMGMRQRFSNIFEKAPST